jgi:2-phosphosulfolactate phosphatase
VFGQNGFDALFEWGQDGLAALAVARPTADVAPVVVVVDVLRFTTAVEVAVGRGAVVIPCPWGDSGRIAALAERFDAQVAVGSSEVTAASPWSLSPVHLAAIPAGTRLVLPSPNGSALTMAAADAGAPVVMAACLRNASAVAAAARAYARARAEDEPGEPAPVAVIAAGEGWPVTPVSPVTPDAPRRLRAAVEDLLGAGAVLSALGAASPSPEARAAIAAFDGMRADLASVLADCDSGRELAAAGFGPDVQIAAEHDVSEVVPVLVDGAYTLCQSFHTGS